MQNTIRLRPNTTPKESPNASDLYHEHPIKILQYSAKNLWLLVFPLLRSLRFFPFSSQNLIEWGKGAWSDLLIAVLILCIGTLRWYFCSYHFDDVSIRAKSGIFLRKEIEIPCSKITASVEEHPFYLRPFHAVRLKISTASGTLPEASMSLILRVDDLHQMRPHIALLRSDKSQTKAYRTAPWRVFLFSALFSSSFSGAIYIAALFFQGGRIVADLFEEFQARALLEDAADRASTIFVGVPRIGLIVSIVILSLWLISFGRNLLRYSNFRIRFGEEFVSIHMGLLNRRRFHLRDSAIVFPDLRQNLIMKWFGIVSLHIRCPGYGSRRDTLPVLIPLVSKRASWTMLEKFHAIKKPAHPIITAKSGIRHFWQFVWPAVIGASSVTIVYFLALWLFPHFREILQFFFVMFLIPFCWFFLVRVVALFSQSIAIDETSVWFHFSKGFLFHTITVPRDNIVRMDIRQTPLQKRYGTCHLYLICNGPTQQRYKLTGLPEAKVQKILEELGAPDFRDPQETA